LRWDNSDQLEIHDGNPTSQEGFAFISKLLALKPFNTYYVRQTFSLVWSFAAPLFMEVLAPNKYIFTVPFESNFTRIINQDPWNVRDSLLLLQPWSPDLAIEEVKFLLYSFWVQVHNLPHQYMATKNAIRIVKGIGNLLELDDKNTIGRWP
jgi:hypothetical protein